MTIPYNDDSLGLGDEDPPAAGWMIVVFAEAFVFALSVATLAWALVRGAKRR